MIFALAPARSYSSEIPISFDICITIILKTRFSLYWYRLIISKHKNSIHNQFFLEHSNTSIWGKGLYMPNVCDCSIGVTRRTHF